MDFTLTDEQQALQGLAAQILTDKGTLLRLNELDASDDWFDRETFRALPRLRLDSTTLVGSLKILSPGKFSRATRASP